MNEIQEKYIYTYQSIADKQPANVKVIQRIETKKKIKVEVSRDLVHCINPFRVESKELQ